MDFLSKHFQETENYALQLAQTAKSGDIFCLCGELGAGKTVFAKGFAKGLGISEEITSPTFTVVNEYEGRLMLYHFDAYRLEEPAMAASFDFQEYFDSKGISLIEWAENIRNIIPPYAKWIDIIRVDGQEETARIIRMR